MTTFSQELSQCVCFVQPEVFCHRVDLVGGSHFGLLDSIVRSAERLCEGELCCLAHRRKVSALCLLYKIYHRVAHLLNGCLNHLVAVRSTNASAALGELPW